MPSIGTNVMSARVKEETIKRFKKVAKKYNTTIPKILDSFAGITPDHSGALNAFFDTDADKLSKELKEAGYDTSEVFRDIREQLLWETT